MHVEVQSKAARPVSTPGAKNRPSINESLLRLPRKTALIAVASLLLALPLRAGDHQPSPAPSANAPAKWISIGPDQRLVYAADARGNQIPDFSNCGYEGGGVPIPLVPVKATVDPAPGDAGARIQAAIDEVSRLPMDANGFRGAVLLRKGTYPIAGEINLNADGVVLRGEGQGADGTKLVATGARQRSLILLGASGRPVSHGDDETGDETPEAAPVETKQSIPITDTYVPVGARSFHVQDASALRVGESVVVFRPSTENWIHDLGMDRIPQNKTHTVMQWTAGSKNLPFRRRVTAVNGNLVTVEAPICCALGIFSSCATYWMTRKPRKTTASWRSIS